MKDVKIKGKDWLYLKAALVTYMEEPFQSQRLQDKVKNIIWGLE